MDDEDWFDDLPDSAVFSLPDPQNAQNAQNANAQGAQEAAGGSPHVYAPCCPTLTRCAPTYPAKQGSCPYAPPPFKINYLGRSLSCALANNLAPIQGAAQVREERLRMQRNREAALAKLAAKRKIPPHDATATNVEAVAKHQRAVHNVDDVDVDIDALLEDEHDIARELDMMQAVSPPEYEDSPPLRL